MMKFSEVFEKLLSQSDGETSVSESIAKSIADKAANGDINAVKFLRDMMDDKSEPLNEIKITIIGE
ncbi:MAG: hypothetical protein IKU25_03280 [Clostridia bacterium]|nr:hypothetical protein [Clostridia bacterium]